MLSLHVAALSEHTQFAMINHSCSELAPCVGYAVIPEIIIV